MAKMVEGQPAPGFRAPSSDGDEVSLEGLRGRNVILYFYPKDDTPGCTKEACGFRDGLGRAREHGAVVLGVSRDGPASHERFRDKYGLNFPLLSDPEGRIVEAYGAVKPTKGGGAGTIRSTFLIDAQGVIRRIWRDVEVDGHVDEVLGALEGVRPPGTTG
jgi:peroxiredoxin Q/BCP